MRPAAIACLSLVLMSMGVVARAADRVEITVFGGVSLLDLHHDEQIYPQCFYPVDVPLSAQPVVPDYLLPPCGPISVSRRLGGSLLHGASVGYRAAARTVVEAAFSIAPAHHSGDDSYYGPAAPVVAYHLDAGLRYDLTVGSSRPFLVAGFGHIVYGGASLGSDRKNWALNLGVGWSGRLSERARLRLEAVDHIVPDHVLDARTAHDVHVRMGVTVIP